MIKTALVTGGTHGIGKAIADSLRQDGYNVSVCARGMYKTDEDFIKCDLSTDEGINYLISQVKEVDILVCNAGGGGRWGKDNWLETDYNVWQEVYDKNAGYTIKLINHYLPKMIEKNWGRVVAITSTLGKESSDNVRPWFQLAKSAQISLMKAYSKNKDYVRNGVTFNCVSPGAIMIEDTGWHKFKLEDEAAFKKYLDSLPMNKLGKPEDVANVVTFLCSEKSNYINGANITIDGGQSYSF